MLELPEPGKTLESDEITQAPDYITKQQLIETYVRGNTHQATQTVKAFLYKMSWARRQILLKTG